MYQCFNHLKIFILIFFFQERSLPRERPKIKTNKSVSNSSREGVNQKQTQNDSLPYYKYIKKKNNRHIPGQAPCPQETTYKNISGESSFYKFLLTKFSSSNRTIILRTTSEPLRSGADPKALGKGRRLYFFNFLFFCLKL